MSNQYCGSLFLEWYWEGKRSRMVSECVFGPFRGSHSWLETGSTQCCASAHVCVSWAPLLNPVHSSAHVSCASLGTAAYISNKLRVQRLNLLTAKTVWEGGLGC